MNPILRGRVITVTPTLDTNIYASGDLMAAALELPLALGGGPIALLQSLYVLDAGKINAAFSVHLFSSQPTIASAVNAALDITAANARGKYLGKIEVAAADYRSWANISVVSYGELNHLCAAVPSTAAPESRVSSLWAVLESRGAGTYAATGLELRFGFRH